jgi:hypothetical protein
MKKLGKLSVLAILGMLVGMTFFSAAPAAAIVVQTEWVDQFGTSVNDWGHHPQPMVYGGHLYIAGMTDGALPGQTSAGGRDNFIRKYDLNGNVIWTRQFGTNSKYAGGFEDDIKMAVGDTGIYAGGRAAGSLHGQKHYGYIDGYVCKFDFDGNLKWTDQFGTGFVDPIHAIAYHSSGVYVTGNSYQHIPGAIGSGDIFIRKYSFDGVVQWTRQYGSFDDDGHAIYVDDSGIYISGRKSTYAGFYGWDIHVQKHDLNGNLIWQRTLGEALTRYEYGLGVAATSQGIYFSAYTQGTLPGETSSGGQDAVIGKYDHSGNLVWLNQFGTSGDEYARLLMDSTGLYTYGDTTGAFPGQTNAGGHDAFVRKYDFDGNELWTFQYGTPADEGASFYTDSTGMYLAGYTTGAIPGETNNGGTDAFVVKFSSGCTMTQLIDMINNAGLSKGITQSLLSKVTAAQKSYDKGKDKTGDNQMKAFINEVEALKGKKIPAATADQFISTANCVIT